MARPHPLTQDMEPLCVLTAVQCLPPQKPGQTRAVLRCSQSIQLQRTNQKEKHAQRIKKQKTMLGIQAAGQRRLMSLQFPTENKFTLQRPFTAKNLKKHRKENINCRHQQYHQSNKPQSEKPWHPSPSYART